MKKKAPSGLVFLKDYFAPYKKEVFLTFACLLTSALSLLSIGKSISYFMDNGFFKQNFLSSIYSFATIFLLVFLLSFSSFGRVYFLNKLGEKVINQLRIDLFRKTVELDYYCFEKIKAGQIISCLTSDMSMIQLILCSSLGVAIRNIFIILGGICMMIATSLKMSLLTILIVPLVVIPIIFFGKKVKIYSKKAQNHLSDISGYVDEIFNNIKLVQICNHQNFEQEKFSNLIKIFYDKSLKSVKSRAYLSFFAIIWVFLGIIFLLFCGNYFLDNQILTKGELASFMFFALIVAGSLASLSNIIGDAQKANGSLERIVELLSNKNAENPLPFSSKPLKIMNQRLKGFIAMDNVDFSYPSNPEEKVLKKLNLSILSGETVAIVGRSGSGKSTIFSLLLKLYNINAGNIYFDGIDYEQMDQSYLREQIGFVTQDPYLFSTSIFENVLYGKKDASYEEVLEACKLAKIDDFLKDLPDGINTKVGNNGIRLSGGQKQRVAIARALLKKPSILLLDEATSALDVEIEKALKDGLETLKGKSSVIIITHRLSTIKNADKIFVLNQGSIEAVGSHELLIKENALYNHLSSLQFTV